MAQRRQTRAVSRTQTSNRVASIRLTVKLVLWAMFFSGLFVLHAHVGLRTASLRAETRRLEGQAERLMEQRRQLRSTLGSAEDSQRIREVAEEELGMVAAVQRQRITVDAETVAEVRDASVLWQSRLSEPDRPASRMDGWIEMLAGLCVDQRNRG
jgi:hypothetical protein